MDHLSHRLRGVKLESRVPQAQEQAPGQAGPGDRPCHSEQLEYRRGLALLYSTEIQKLP